MTTIIVYKNNKQQYKGFVCMGHAGYAKKLFFMRQPDILCSAISTLVINTLNSLEKITNEAENIVLDTNEETGFIKCDFIAPITNTSSIVLLDSMLLGLSDLNKEYGNEYLQVKFEEV